MCGWVAWISPEAAVDSALLTRMRDTLTHRGPDHGANWIHPDKRIGFGHRRLAVIDPSHASDQPLYDRHTKNCIAFNGEIYNYLELREELQALGHHFETQGDTEVLLASYRQWGAQCLARLNGMFAFAIWDEVAGELFVARDRFGEKPLFVGRTALGDVLLASEMKAILMHPAMAVEANAEAVARYVQGSWYEDDDLTFFAGVVRVPPAYALRLNAEGGEISRQRYWTPTYDGAKSRSNDAQMVARFRDLFARSVRMRLRADVPVGSSLSGGLDSSVIVGAMAEIRRETPFEQRTFSACFAEDPTLCEAEFVDAVVAHTDVQSFRVNPDPHGLMVESAKLHWHQEEPFLSASIYLQWCVARLAKEHATTVLLDGQGADELLVGYQFWFPHYQLDLLDRGHYLRLVMDSWRFSRRLKRAARHYPESARRFNAGAAHGVVRLLAGWLRPLRAQASRAGVPTLRRGRRLQRVLAEALHYNSLPMLLRYADRNAMAFSRETRMPFLDHDLVDFVQCLPTSFLIRRGWQKWILRQAGAGWIPEKVRWRADKVGYAAPLDYWLRGALKDWAHARLFSQVLAGVAGYDREWIHQRWQEHQSGTANHSWALWRWISLAEWFALLHAGVWKQGMGDSADAAA